MRVEDLHDACPVYLKNEGAGYYCPWAPIYCGTCTYEWMIGKQQKNIWREIEYERDNMPNEELCIQEGNRELWSSEPRTDVI